MLRCSNPQGCSAPVLGQTSPAHELDGRAFLAALDGQAHSASRVAGLSLVVLLPQVKSIRDESDLCNVGQFAKACVFELDAIAVRDLHIETAAVLHDGSLTKARFLEFNSYRVT